MESIINEHEKRVEVCPSPLLFDTYFQNKDCIVVVIDVFRATSAICTAFANGIERVRTVVNVDEAKAYQEKGWLAAAERNGEVVEGFELGNSPFHYSRELVNGKQLALTTTNGTKAVGVAKKANTILIGSFLNLSSIVKYINNSPKDVLLLCAGWKNRFNLEDTLFAGAVVNELSKNEIFRGKSDSAIAAENLYNHAKSDLMSYLESSSHRNRLARLNLHQDIEFCLQHDKFDVLPILKNEDFVLEKL